MLDDLERKLLRVLNNYALRHRSAPSVRDLERMMGRKMTVINRGLAGLQQKGYIDWQPPYLDTIRIKEAWDREAPSILTVKPKETNDTRYWTEY